MKNTKLNINNSAIIIRGESSGHKSKDLDKFVKLNGDKSNHHLCNIHLSNGGYPAVNGYEKPLFELDSNGDVTVNISGYVLLPYEFLLISTKEELDDIVKNKMHDEDLSQILEKENSEDK